MVMIASTPWAADNKVYKLRLASVSGPSHLHNVVMKEWAETVKKETDGRLDIRILDGAQLGEEREYVEGMRLGTIDIAQVSTGPIRALFPNSWFAHFPMFFRTTNK